jgi:hypothetical protein
MKLLFAFLAIAPAAVFARPSFALSAAARPDSASADAADTLDASKTFGATSPEARSKIDATRNMKQRDPMKVIVVGCSLAGLSVALGLISKDDTVSVEIVEIRDTFESRGSTFGLAPNGQIALEEICPRVLEHLKSIGIFMQISNGYMLPWWEVRDSLLEEARKALSERLSTRTRTISKLH